MRSILFGAALMVLACSSEGLPPAKIELYPGKETSIWQAVPAVSQVKIAEIDRYGTRTDYTTLASVPTAAATGSFELTHDTTAQYEVRGLDSQGKAQVLGLSWYYDTLGLQGASLSLFVGRVGTFGRLDGTMSDGQGEHPPLALLGGRFVLSAGSSVSKSIAVDGLDMGIWWPSTQETRTCDQASCKVESLLVANQSQMLAVGADWAYLTDYSQIGFKDSTEPSKPSGLKSWGDLAGGMAVSAPDGSAYLVGGTRPESPTKNVLRLSSTGALANLQLLTARAGAAATWVAGKGLLVTGGASDGAGAELLPEGASEFVALPFAAMPITGAALVSFDKEHVLQVGGKQGLDWASSVTLDLSCTDHCEPLPFQAALGIDRSQAFDLHDGSVFAFGDDASGFSKAYLIGAGDPLEVPLKEPRKHGAAIQSALGQIVVLGGTAGDKSELTTIELFTPSCLGDCSTR